MTVGERIELAVLTLSGVIFGILTAAFLMIRVGGWPFPITALLAAAGNIVMLRLASSYTASRWRFAPITGWTGVTVSAMLPVLGNGALLGDWRVLLLLAGGLAVPAYYAANQRMRALNASGPRRR